jgi:hypothetical protein
MRTSPALLITMLKFSEKTPSTSPRGMSLEDLGTVVRNPIAAIANSSSKDSPSMGQIMGLVSNPYRVVTDAFANDMVRNAALLSGGTRASKPRATPNGVFDDAASLVRQAKKRAIYRDR